MTIRLALPADIPQMQRIRASVRENRLSDPSRVQPHHVEQMLQSGRGWVCEAEAAVVGFAIADLRTASVWALFVDPVYEGQGIGRRLHDALVDWLFAAGVERITLTTDPNTRAERFYTAAGWKAIGMEANGEVRFALHRERWVRTELIQPG